MSEISKEAVDLIVSEEVSSPAVYEKKYRRPEWPGAMSGVTIGCGYDVGQNSQAQLRKDWDGVIPAAMIDALAQTCGITGEAAKPHAHRLRAVVDVPWDAALKVFEKNTLPRYIALARRHLPNTEKLSPDSFGAIVSLVFNRGASFGNDGARYVEMRNIKAHMLTGQFYKIPAEFRAMKRLWPNLPGLLRRRDREADLFAKGLKAAVVPPASKPAPAPSPAPAPKPPANTARDTGIGALILAGVAGVWTFATSHPVGTGIGVLACAVGIYALIRYLKPESSK